eukprot:4031172-Alexandrium_andersonii.AAC.1
MSTARTTLWLKLDTLIYKSQPWVRRAKHGATRAGMRHSKRGGVQLGPFHSAGEDLSPCWRG